MQACSVKMVGYWPCSVCDFIGLDFVSVHEHAKKNTLILVSVECRIGTDV